MAMHSIRKVMSPEELKSTYALKAEHKELKKQKDAMIRDVLTGASDKFLVIIGPCSADNEDSVCDYISRLAKVSNFPCP